MSRSIGYRVAEGIGGGGAEIEVRLGGGEAEVGLDGRLRGVGKSEDSPFFCDFIILCDG